MDEAGEEANPEAMASEVFRADRARRRANLRAHLRAVFAGQRFDEVLPEDQLCSR